MEEEQKVPHNQNQFHPAAIDFGDQEDLSRPHHYPTPDMNRIGMPDSNIDEVVFEDDRDRSPMAQRGQFDEEDSPAVAARQSISDVSHQGGSKQKKPSGKLKKKLKGIKSESKIQTAKRIFEEDEQNTRFKRRHEIARHGQDDYGNYEEGREANQIEQASKRVGNL